MAPTIKFECIRFPFKSKIYLIKIYNHFLTSGIVNNLNVLHDYIECITRLHELSKSQDDHIVQSTMPGLHTVCLYTCMCM